MKSKVSAWALLAAGVVFGAAACGGSGGSRRWRGGRWSRAGWHGRGRAGRQRRREWPHRERGVSCLRGDGVRRGLQRLQVGWDLLGARRLLARVRGGGRDLRPGLCRWIPSERCWPSGGRRGCGDLLGVRSWAVSGGVRGGPGRRGRGRRRPAPTDERLDLRRQSGGDRGVVLRDRG